MGVGEVKIGSVQRQLDALVERQALHVRVFVARAFANVKPEAVVQVLRSSSAQLHLQHNTLQHPVMSDCGWLWEIWYG
jgi:hypothetical protein